MSKKKGNTGSAKPAAPVAPEMIDHVATQEDLDNNPELVEKGVQVGDTIQLPKVENLTEEEKALALEEQQKAEAEAAKKDQEKAAKAAKKQAEKTAKERAELAEDEHKAPADALEKEVRAAKLNDHPFRVEYAGNVQLFIVNVSDYRLKNFLLTTGRLIEDTGEFDVDFEEGEMVMVIK